MVRCSNSSILKSIFSLKCEFFELWNVYILYSRFILVWLLLLLFWLIFFTWCCDIIKIPKTQFMWLIIIIYFSHEKSCHVKLFSSPKNWIIPLTTFSIWWSTFWTSSWLTFQWVFQHTNKYVCYWWKEEKNNKFSRALNICSLLLLHNESICCINNFITESSWLLMCAAYFCTCRLFCISYSHRMSFITVFVCIFPPIFLLLLLFNAAITAQHIFICFFLANQYSSMFLWRPIWSFFDDA